MIFVQARWRGGSYDSMFPAYWAHHGVPNLEIGLCVGVDSVCPVSFALCSILGGYEMGCTGHVKGLYANGF
jgi:hypothetical protein